MAFMKVHRYTTHLHWTGNKGQGTKNYRVYSRDHEISIEGGLLPIPGSSDPSFHGDPARFNPEELLVASLSACHMLWYLHLCAVNGVVVVGYTDAAKGYMQEHDDGSGQFGEVRLSPVVTVQTADMKEVAMQLHHRAHKMCFIARSVNFPVRTEGKVKVE